jgi:hypothetical protein
LALKVEGIVNRTVNAEEALGGSSRLELLQLALASSDCLMQILRPIVCSLALLMVAGKSEMPEGSAVGAQLVGRHPGRREALFAEQLAHQLDGRRPVATTLDQDLEDLALVIDGTTQIHLLARDPDDHFVEMPAIARSRTAPSQSASDRRSEFEHPTANAFVGEAEATPGKQLLDIAIAQGEAKVQPHGVPDDDRRKTMPAIGDRSHARSLRRTPRSSRPFS